MKWKKIAGFDNYSVSDTGLFRRDACIIKHQKTDTSLVRSRVHKERMLDVSDNRGYSKVTLAKNNRMKSFAAHRIVAIAFLPNPENKPQVNHINGNKKDNRVENLEWCTREENMIHASRVLKNDFGKNKRVKVIRNDNIVFNSLKNAADAIGAKPQDICNVLKGRASHAHGYSFEYAL